MEGYNWSQRTQVPQSPERQGAGGEDELHPDQQSAASALKSSVVASGQPGGATSGNGVLVPADQAVNKKVEGAHFWSSYIPNLEKYAAEEHLGNYVVADRKTGAKVWESMPIYVRAGMSLLFATLLGYKYIEHLLIEQSIRQGQLFDREEGAYDHIQSFIQTYNLTATLDQLACPDLRSYRTFNSFFSRALKTGARPPDGSGDSRIVVSAADCRLTVWQSVDSATELWIKGRQFTISRLLHDKDCLFAHPAYQNGIALAIFRLAPQDYHRWHTPMSGILGPVHCIDGSLYTVNPMAVHNPDVDVFTQNKRDVQILSVPSPKLGQLDIPIAIVSIGAMLVGSIAYLKQEGDAVLKGEELGYFAYGGSTVIVLFPTLHVEFDADLVKSSMSGMETIVRVGERIALFGA